MTDAKIQGFIDRCDTLLATAGELSQHYANTGSSLTIPLANLMRLVTTLRQQAVDGSLRRPEGGRPPLGLTLFLGEYEWRPDGTKIEIDAESLEGYWERELC